MQRRIDATVVIGSDRKTVSVWVDEDASDATREAAVEEIVGDVRSWESEPVELEGWGETGWVQGDGRDAMPRREPGW